MTSATNIKQYDKYDIINIFLFISSNPNCSRKNICDFVEIGEGSLKSILNILEKNQLIKKSKTGNCLSEKGNLLYKKIKKEIDNIIKLSYDIFKDGFHVFSLKVKKYEKTKIIHAFMARDYAIRCGCWSAMILIYDGENLKLNVEEKYSFDEIKNHFILNKDELVVVVSAQTNRLAINGILRVIEYLNENLNKSFNLFNI